jgi:hypothetical protein
VAEGYNHLCADSTTSSIGEIINRYRRARDIRYGSCAADERSSPSVQSASTAPRSSTLAVFGEGAEMDRPNGLCCGR